MKKWLLNSIALVVTTHNKLKKAANGTSTQVATCTTNKWTAKINEKEIYNMRGPPGRREEEKRQSQLLPPPKASVAKHQRTQKEEPVLGGSPRIKLSPFPHVFDHSISIQSCLVVATLTKAQFLSPFLCQIYCIGPVGFELIHLIVKSTQTRTLQKELSLSGYFGGWFSSKKFG